MLSRILARSPTLFFTNSKLVQARFVTDADTTKKSETPSSSSKVAKASAKDLSTKSTKMAEVFAKVEVQRKKEQRDLIISKKLAHHAGPSSFFQDCTIYLCTCKSSKSYPLCDRSHLHNPHFYPKKHKVENVDVKEFPEMLLCKCGKSRTVPYCDEETCLKEMKNSQGK